MVAGIFVLCSLSLCLASDVLLEFFVCVFFRSLEFFFKIFVILLLDLFSNFVLVRLKRGTFLGLFVVFFSHFYPPFFFIDGLLVNHVAIMV